eukprot:TRINITY_DN14390_c0_g1_i3.p1 TRINITY_DN14390_c0_g1~~TRINITY_DN14390_c0_g1_i3.p1  ORF type:complete len:424 (-),score=43.72 TRINITY_DN14390_c0_g1_i3:1298-2569(-)
MIPFEVDSVAMTDNGSSKTEKDIQIAANGQFVARMVYIIMGIGLLFPWNAFLTAIDYLEKVYPGRHVDRTFTVVYLPVNVCTLALAIHFNSFISGRTRIIVAFIGYTITMAVVPMLDAALIGGSGTGTDVSYALTCAAVGISGLCDGFGQGALFGETARLPPEFTQAMVQGTAVSGVFVSILRIITKASMEKNARASAMLYFSISVVFTFMCTLLYSVYLPNIPYIKQNLGRKYQVIKFELEHEELDFNSDQTITSEKQGKFRYFFAFKKVWREALSNFLIYVITLSIFPGFLVEDIESPGLKTWYPVLLIFMFNFADFVGKSLPPFNLLQKSSLILFWTVMRVFFIPIFAVSAHYKLQDYWFFTLTFVLGVSNGYLTDLAMMSAPLKLKQAVMQEIVGNIMVFALVSGLLVGAILGWIWVWV